MLLTLKVLKANKIRRVINVFYYNQKVVPIKKSVHNSLSDSFIWKEAQECGQNFLYFKGYRELCGHEAGTVVSCALREDEHFGDHFLESDLVPYDLCEDKDEDVIEFAEVTLQDLVELLNKSILKGEDKFLVRRVQ